MKSAFPPRLRFSILTVFLGCLAGATAQDAKPFTHKVYNDIMLSLDVSIDDPDRIIDYLDGPRILERAKDHDPWVGDPKIWSEGEFVESDFPKIYPVGTPGVNVACSKHIRIIYGNHPMMTEEYVRGNLRMFEECLKLFYFKTGFPVPFEAHDPAKRDGKKHKVNILVGASNLPPHNGEPQFTGGGAFGGYDGESGFGFLYVGPEYMRHTPPSGATPHELGHSVQNHCNTHSKGSGFWWEAHANWMMLQFLNTYPAATNVEDNAELYWGHGRHYYDCWHIFEHLKDEPGFGYDFVRKIWTEGGKAEDDEYLWSKAERFATAMSPPRSMSDEWGKMARRNVTWDYRRHDIFVKQDETSGGKKLRSRVVLEPVPAQPGWWRGPWHMAPQQFGYNICPLKPTARSVTVDLQGYANPARGSDWRASLVAVNSTGAPHYSALWSRGPQTLVLNDDDKELYLVVSATPRVMELVPETDYRGLEKERHPFAVKLTGAEPLDLLAAPHEPGTKEGGKPHANGGGFVADSAKVEATTFVGPHARVLDRAKVLGNSRIEDWAVVRGDATVRDRAVVSGHALIDDRGRVEENARVADYGLVKDNAVVSGFARILERGTAMGSVRVSDFATHKGHSASWGERTFGTATLDGDYANSLSVGKGTWFHWFVNKQENADSAEDTRGVSAQFLFKKAHPYLAWDTFGETHGLLVGSPEIKADTSFGGTEEIADKVDAVVKLDQANNSGENWGALIRGYLHPPSAGEFTFDIEADNSGELWLSSDESPRNKKKIADSAEKKSKAVKLDPAKAYYFELLHKQGLGAENARVGWQRAGGAREIIAGDALSIEPRGLRGSARRKTWLGIPGDDVKDLTSSPKFKPDTTRPIAKGTLLLNGRDQYVELRRDIAYRSAFSAEMMVKREALKTAATLFEFSSPDGKNRLALTIGANGQPRLTVCRDGKETALAAQFAVPPAQWVKVGVSLGDGGTVLLLNDRVAAENAQLVVRPWDLGLSAGFLGRSLEGAWFKGALSDVTFYCVPIFDRSPPQPNPAQWQLKPTPLSATAIIMRAVPGRKPLGSVEYRYADGGRAFDSGWIKSPEFTVANLRPGRVLNLAFMMRDSAGNAGKPSELVKLTMPVKQPPAFQFEGDLCVVRAPHFHEKFETKESPWQEVKRADFSAGTGIEVPDGGRESDAFAIISGEAPRLDYRVNFAKAGKYFATFRCWAPHNGNNIFFAGSDFTTKPKRTEFTPGKPLWSETVELEIATPGIHLVHLWMGKDGAQFDSIAISAEAAKLPNGDTPAAKESAQK